MRIRVLVAALLLLTGCAAKSAPVPLPGVQQAGGLAEVRYQASVTHDSKRSPEERVRSANAAWGKLVALLADPSSRQILPAQWEEQVSEGAGAFVRMQESGSLRLYAVSLPVPGGEPPFERVLAQWQAPDGKLQVSELKGLPGGRLLTHRLQTDRNNPSVLVALWEMPGEGGGFAGHFHWDKGEFKLVQGAFATLPKEAGLTTLEVRDGFLVAQFPPEDGWPGAEFDTNFPLRFYVHPDWYVDHKDGRYTLGDDRAPGMYQAFAEALDKTGAPAERQASWLKASRKLPLYLAEMEGWHEPLVDKLPKGSAVMSDAHGHVSVRLVSIPAPDFIGGHYSVAQFRVSNGLPTAQPLYIPGAAVSARLFANDGLPGMLVASTRADGFAVTMLKLDVDGLWEKAPEWYGWLPPGMDSWNLKREDHHLFVFQPEDGELQVTGQPPVIQGCLGANCVPLDFQTGQKLSAVSWLVSRLDRMTRANDAEMLADIELLRQFLLSPAAKEVPSDQFERVFAQGRVAAFATPSVRVVGLPMNATGVAPLVVQWEGGILVEQPLPFGVFQWISARPLDETHLAVVGRTSDSAALVVFRKTETGWENGADLIQPAGLQAGTLRIDAPGALIRGLGVWGSATLSIGVTADGKTYQFCESPNRGCVRFVWENGRLAGPR